MPLLAAMAQPMRVRFGAAVIVRFSAVAVVAVVVLVVTGIYRALAELPSFDALWTTDYGLALLAKLVVFAVMLALAAWNRLVLHPRVERAALGLAGPADGDGESALRASVRAEVAERVRREGWSFYRAVANGVFTIAGDGCVDYPSIFKILARADYRGWLVVEAEEDQIGRAHV